MDDTLTRYAKFQKIGGFWTLTAISPLVLEPASGEKKASITRVTIYNDDEEVLSITDPTQLIDLDNLPVFSPYSQVKVEVEVEYSGESGYDPSTHVFIHHGLRLIEPHCRDFAYDDGGTNPASGDATADDNIYTRLYTTGLGSGYWKRGAGDVLDSTCLHSTDDDYQSNAWVIPYKVSSQ